MTINSHPDCERCNAPVGPFTPSEFVNLFGIVPSTKEHIELPPEVVAAAADVDRLADEFDEASGQWGAATQALARMHPKDPKRSGLERLRDAAWQAREDLSSELTQARVRYHKVLADFNHQRRVAEVPARVDAAPAMSASERRLTFKQLIGSNKEKR